MNNNFSFGGIKVNSRKQVLNLKLKSNPVLADHSDRIGYGNNKDTITILADEYYNDVQLKAIDTFLRDNGCTKYIMLCTLNCDITKDEVKDDQKTGIIDFYKNNRSKYEDFIPPGSQIITSGPALYSHLREDDVYPSYVQQIVFGRSDFWFSFDLTEKGNWIYPIESFRDLFAAGFNKPVDSYKTRLAELQIQKVSNCKFRPAPRYAKLNKVFITSKEDFYKRFWEPNKNKKDITVAWDLETSGLNWFKDRIGCITLCFEDDPNTGYYIPWNYVDKEKLDDLFGRVRQCGANLKYDWHYIHHHGLKNMRIDEDVCGLGQILDETRSNSLKTLAFFYSEYGGYERALDIYKKKYNIESYLDIDEDILKEYAIMDAIVTMRVWKNMMAHMRALDKQYPNEICPWNTLERYYYYRKIPATNLYAEMEHKGVCVNKPKLDTLRVEMLEYQNSLKKQLAEAFNVNEDFDFGSNQELGKLLKRKGWECLGLNKAGDYSVGDFQLERWGKDHPEAKIIQTLRSITVLINTFVGDEEGTKGWSKYLVHHDEDPDYLWRMHPDFYPLGADSGRSRCQRPNMQQVPTRGKFTKEIKSCLCTPNDEDYYLVTLDFSSLQMRLATINCTQWGFPDKNLINAFNGPNSDIHSSTGYLTFCLGRKYDVEEVEVEQNGKIYHFLGPEHVLTKNRGLVTASDLQEDDILDIKDNAP